MNKLNFFIILILSSLSIQAQDTLTIGEVFDFEINDLFHIKNMDNSIPPAGSKTLILGKYYSTNNDTVFYKTHSVNYGSTFYPNPQPHVEYSFYEEHDTLFYTNLNSPITSYDSGFSQSVYIDTTKYCDSIVIGYSYCSKSKGCTQKEFGKGLGVTMLYKDGIGNSYDYQLVYYKKNGKSCGNYDTICEFILNTPPTVEPIQFELYPNPATGQITLQCQNLPNNAVAFLYNQIGQHIRIFQLSDQKQRMDISALKPGIYFIEIRSKNLRKTQKLIIQ